jgi:DegV family protein with EDD domain
MPSSTCILTDSSAQFPQLSFSGRDRVRIVPLDIEYAGELHKEGAEIKVANLEPYANSRTQPRIIPPSVETFRDLYLTLSRSYDNILVIVLSAQLSNVFDNAALAAQALQGARPIQVVNSQTTSVGLGLLVQAAAEMVEKGGTIVEAERLVRQMIPHIYTLVCSPSLSYMHYAGFLDHAQATLGEMLGIYPIFTLEEGRLTPLDKVRNYRYALEFFQEFLEEYDDLKHIALLQSSPGNVQESRTLRQFAQECFPHTSYTEHAMNVPFAMLFGPKAWSMIVAENPESAP